jgi:hypothetical protein
MADFADLVSPDEAARAFEASGLLERMGPKNLKARGATSARGYAEQYRRGLIAWESVSEEEKASAREAVAEAKKACAAAEYFGLARMPWRICPSDATVENGYPHTVGDVLIIPLERIRRGGESLAKLLVHEAVHVAQRRDPEGAYGLVVDKWGFRALTRDETSRVAQLGEARVNPDTDGRVYRLGNEICYPVFTNDPESLADIELRPSAGHARFRGVAQNHEHPFEIMAETIADSAAVFF